MLAFVPRLARLTTTPRILTTYAAAPRRYRPRAPRAAMYPPTRRDETVVDELHGVKVADPFRWLEDPDSPETAAWVDAQNAVTQRYLQRAGGLREKFRAAVENNLNYDRFSCAWKKGQFFYYSHHVALANQAVIMQMRSIDGEPRVFMDPNALAEDGTASLGTMRFAENGQFVAYGVQRGGSDWQDIMVMDCETLEVMPEVLEWAKFTSIAWTHDASGFYYARYPTPESLAGVEDRDKRGAETDEAKDQAVYYHVVGTPQSEDRLVYTDAEFPKRIYGLQTTLDGHYLLITISEDCAPKNMLWYVDLTQHFGDEAEHIVRLIDASYDAQFSLIANDDSLFYLETNWKAPRNRIIAVDVNAPGDKWAEIVPEHPTNVLSDTSAVNHDQLALVYMEDANDKLSVHALKTGEKLYDVPLPDLGGVSVRASRSESFLMYMFTSFLYPGTVYYVDLTLSVDEGTRVFRSMTPPGFDPSQYCTRQAFYTSKDGVTKVPMFIVGPREPEQAAPKKRPCMLYGYGGFMISLTPFYSARWVSWLECLGGVIAVANIRGGNEYGSEWHDQGILGNKQNVFDDFQYAARSLVDLGITEPKSLLIQGGSNGGLLVGACINQAPELFGAAVAQVGVHDMLRFHKFTIGSAWVSDYGNPDNAADFEHQLKYSPLHNVFSPDERGTPYPAVLLTTGDHDDRVVPLHTLKYGATLQQTAGSTELQHDKPLLIRVDVKAGHGAGKPTSKVIDEICDTLLFAALALDVKSADA